MKLKSLVLILSLFNLWSCAPPPEKITCKPYLKITDTGSEISLWDMNHNRDAHGKCDEVIDQTFEPVIIGS